ncbi:PilX N-terminal domain-containing pilus assembly protein [Halioxenophilus sp. WMMB6]|uniref:pilus assembly PilX family protein n=1 Tax=Halioxenophilus sp. WMMB6 TaxID=3073815 RepID=UPI00295E9C99|nr:PilX N-terminal domain-containing pilus assembly protein [Halioxenophilus sp. WMMB6]
MTVVKKQSFNPGNQSGAVLIISLVVLLVLTVIVMSANRGVVVQERMTSAIRETNLAFQTAETALVEAEAFLDTISDLSDFSDTGANGLYTEGNGPADYTAVAAWTDSLTREANGMMDGYSAQYYIENLGEFTLAGLAKDISLSNDYNQPDVKPVAEVFRIVVRSVGPNGLTQQIIAGYYSRSL